MATYSHSNATPHHDQHRHIFQPPQSPASTGISPALVTSNDYFSPPSRKRARPDSSHSNDHQQTPWTEVSRDWNQYPTPSDQMLLSDGPQVNEHYRLAGGLDTPGLMEASREHLDSDMECRRRIRDSDSLRPAQNMPLTGPLARERNGIARMPASPNGQPTQQGWTNFAFNLVGKVFTFGTSVVRGFYAGGGKGYDISQTTSGGWNAPPAYSMGTPVPGSWQEDEFLGDFEQDNPNSPSNSSFRRPPNKRRQTDKESWVLVGTPDTTAVDTSPKRKTSSNNIPTKARPSLASRASSRRSLAPAVSRRQSSYITHAGSPAAVYTPQPQNETLHRRASFAPVRTSISRPSSAGAGGASSSEAKRTPRPSLSTNLLPSPIPNDTTNSTYVSPEAERYMKRQAKQDKAADKAMSKMSKQLEDLIRQGQQALGTKFEVEGGGECGDGEGDFEIDEGFVDEDW